MLKWIIAAAGVCLASTVAEARRAVVVPAPCFFCVQAAPVQAVPRRLQRRPVNRSRRSVRRSGRSDKPKPPAVKWCAASPDKLRSMRLASLSAFIPDRERYLAWVNEPAPADPGAIDIGFMIELAIARDYLVRTTTPGATMAAQGVRQALSCMHPVFVIRLARTIRQARQAGLGSAGVYSACRPPILGVGGFADKFMSMHPYGLAVDMMGIGRPGSAEALLFYRIAAANRIYNPYGPYNRAEWNHFQPTFARAVTRGMDLRSTITARGPKDLDRMWRVAANYISDRIADPVPPRVRSQRRRHWYASRQTSRHHRYAGIRRRAV